MTARRTTRIAALGAGLLALAMFSASPAGAADGAQAEATVNSSTVNVGTADAINQTLGIINQACVDAAQVGDTATSALATGSGITVASQQAGTGLNLAVSLPALTSSLPALDSLPVLGSLAGQVAAQPLKVSCKTSADGSGLGVSAAGVEALVQAIAPGVDVSTLLPSANVAASTGSTPAPSANASAAPTAIKAQGTAQSPSVRASASAPSASTTATATPASSSGGSISGALAHTGAGLGALGLLGTMLFGSGRLLSLGRKLLRAG
jgi:hypothetical protein